MPFKDIKKNIHVQSKQFCSISIENKITFLGGMDPVTWEIEICFAEIQIYTCNNKHALFWDGPNI